MKEMERVKELIYKLDLEIDKERKESKIEKVLKKLNLIHCNIEKIKSIAVDLFIAMMSLKDEVKAKEAEQKKEIERLEKRLKSFELIALATTNFDGKGFFPFTEEEAREAVHEAILDMRNIGHYIEITATPVESGGIKGYRFKVSEAHDGSIIW